MQTEATPTVFVIDADAISRNAVRDLARSMRLDCETYTSGEEFLDAYDGSRPGCLVTEVRIPDLSGPQIQQRLAMDEEPLPVIFLTAHASVPIVVRAMQQGAIDFLEKPPREQELWEAIQRALQEYRRRRDALAEKRLTQQRLARLTPKQQEVLQLLAEGKGTEAIAGELHISKRTVELRRAGAMDKLQIGTPAQLMRFAIAAFNGHSEHLDDSVIAAETPGPNGDHRALARHRPR